MIQINDHQNAQLLSYSIHKCDMIEIFGQFPLQVFWF
jgi:hypothetical protein